MPLSKQDKVLVTCPRCRHSQPEPHGAYSTVCRKCGRHFRLEEVLHPSPEALPAAPPQKQIRCFECGAELEVPATAESTMCKRCSRYVDLKDYHISGATSKNFKTKGAFVIEPKGYVFNTEAIVGEAIIKGRFLGKLIAERSLTIHTTADIKGSFTAGLLVIPAANHFRWPKPIRVGSAEVAGELLATLQAQHTVILRSTARFFGNLDAGSLSIEAGAVVVGSLRIGSRP